MGTLLSGIDWLYFFSFLCHLSALNVVFLSRILWAQIQQHFFWAPSNNILFNSSFSYFSFFAPSPPEGTFQTFLTHSFCISFHALLTHFYYMKLLWPWFSTGGRHFWIFLAFPYHIWLNTMTTFNIASIIPQFCKHKERFMAEYINVSLDVWQLFLITNLPYPSPKFSSFLNFQIPSCDISVDSPLTIV